MVKTYQAMLKGGRLDWGDAGPPRALLSLQVPVQLTLLDADMKITSNGVAMALALEKIAETTQAATYGDGSSWQKEAREDRPLGGREE